MWSNCHTVHTRLAICQFAMDHVATLYKKIIFSHQKKKEHIQWKKVYLTFKQLTSTWRIKNPCVLFNIKEHRSLTVGTMLKNRDCTMCPKPWSHHRTHTMRWHMLERARVQVSSSHASRRLEGSTERVDPVQTIPIPRRGTSRTTKRKRE